MKNNNVIIFLLAVAIIAAVVFAMKGKGGSEAGGQAASGTSDYEKIETVRQAVEQVAGTAAVKTVGTDQGQWYVYDLRLIYQKDGEFFSKLKDKLGEGFDTQLSNGDYLFIGVLPMNNSYRIYAGDPANENNMLYPEWKYTRLEKK